MTPRDEITRLINKYLRRLQILKEQEASYGLAVPSHIVVEIEDIEAKVSKLQAELEQSEEESEPSLQTLPEMVLIPAGPFKMGTSISPDIEYFRNQDWVWVRNWYTNGIYKWEQPVHTVELPAYKISRFPITNHQYYYFVLNTGHSKPRHWSRGIISDRTENHPVVNVSWHDANMYCSWLSNITHQEYRLPTEAEWEKAARGQEGRRWPWGNEWDRQRCNSKAFEIGGDTLPVDHFGEKGQSQYRIADMIGNAAEWCNTKWGKLWHRPAYGYPYDMSDGREAKDGDELRVVRGGSYRGPLSDARCAARSRYPPDKRISTLGFRCVCE